MKKRVIVLSAIFFLVCTGLLSGMALAQKGIHAEIDQQQRRIDKGIASGALTRNEAEVLQGNLSYIRSTYDRARTDGTLTPREEKRLRTMLNENSKQIYQKKHNMPVRKLY
ncbi:hypothetical protein [Syntrophobacter fumaroxidans]|uniref:Uncharacterized protein n=1 Tax=Syntrophobacter fumaroxidans (strain DSM 10017 / MPOB) TaxID=335543 RepID=A0LJW4_SYNFM|nr:hypothetical protein [Syntrophobacter fumaroxidans]ABK17716.1 conserved hypothetical protein [Syntrophobacter fumaroxidans MPOB]